jgi:hypothetical protein
MQTNDPRVEEVLRQVAEESKRDGCTLYWPLTKTQVERAVSLALERAARDEREACAKAVCWPLAPETHAKGVHTHACDVIRARADRPAETEEER